MNQTAQVRNSFKQGFSDGVPIALGYLSVSFAFGISAVSAGLDPLQAVAISMTNLTSAGQVAGLGVMVGMASLIEMAATQLVINLRYALMSLSLSQRFDKSVSLLQRFIIAFFNTDEIFAVATGSAGRVGTRYMLGLACGPYFGWAGGTFLGAFSGGLLPAALCSALGIAIYGMFVAIVVPVAKKSRAVLCVAAFAAALRCVLYYFVPQVSAGFAIILCAVGASVFGAAAFPRKEAA